MLAVPLQASASHNSFGERIEITQGDEVDPETGDLAADVPQDGYVDDKTNIYQQGFYQSNDLPVRQGPSDQSGAFYTDCRGYDEFASAAEDSEFTQKQHYEDALPGVDIAGDQLDEENDACWVGYLDKQNEYFLGGAFQWRFTAQDLTPGNTHDPFYFLNPSPDDEDCNRGDWVTGQVEGDDEQVSNCEDASHEAWWPASWHRAVDTDLVEAPLGGDDGTNCQEATCVGVDVSEMGEGDGEDARDYHGSGTISLPLEFTRTTFLFGYAHPENSESDEYDVGPNDAPFSQPLWGVPDKACGDRVPVEDCQLLGPEDLKLYDTVHDDGLEDDERGRLCSFNPDSSILNPSGLAGGPCGVFGSEVTTFIKDGSAGGFGTDTVETYQSTFPGWKNPLLTVLHHGHLSPPCKAAMFGSENTTGNFYDEGHKDYEEQSRPGETCTAGVLITSSQPYERGITAVNPKVPNGEDQVWCMRPQIMSDGETVPSGPHAGASAPGVYGDYQAAAIDVDIHPMALDAIFAGIAHDGNGVPGYEGYHETFGDTINTADQAVGTAFGVANDVADEADSAADDTLEQLPEELPGEDEVNDVLDQVFDRANAVTDTTFNASDRVGTESSDAEPNNQVGEENWDPFEDPIPPGISCQNGVPIFGDGDDAQQGAVQFDNTVNRFSANLLGVNTWLKDPTILDEEGLPADEDNTTDGTWQTDSYSFSGPLRAFVDSSGDESFSGCATSTGQPQPNNDNCVWSALWDAYNPSCSGSDDTSCEELLRQDGYVVTEQDVTTDRPFGVGLVSTLEVSGTTLLWTTDATATGIVDEAQIVNQDPAQSTCVIMTSHSFQDKLATHVGDTGATDQTFDQDERSALCPDHTDDRIVEWHDAFSGQGGPGSQGFSSSVSWAKITPTPDAARDAQGMQDDRLCVTGVFSTADDRLDAGVEGTKDNIALGADNTETYYTDCDLLTSHEDPDGEPNDDHPLDAKSFEFPDYSQRDIDYRG